MTMKTQILGWIWAFKDQINRSHQLFDAGKQATVSVVNRIISPIMTLSTRAIIKQLHLYDVWQEVDRICWNVSFCEEFIRWERFMRWSPLSYLKLFIVFYLPTQAKLLSSHMYKI